MTPEELIQLLQEGQVLDLFASPTDNSAASLLAACPREMQHHCRVKNYSPFILYISQDHSTSPTYHLVTDELFNELIATAILDSSDITLTSNLLRMIGQIILNLSQSSMEDKVGLIISTLSYQQTLLTEYEQTLYTLYEASNQDTQVQFLNILLTICSKSSSNNLSPLVSMLFDKINIAYLKSLDNDNILEIFKLAISKNQLNVIRLIFLAHSQNSMLQKEARDILNRFTPTYVTVKQQIHGLLYAYTQSVLVEDSAYSFLTSHYLDYCARQIPARTEDIKSRLAIDWRQQLGKGTESSMVPLTLIPTILQISHSLFPDLNVIAAKQELLEYIGTELKRLEGHRRALTSQGARKQFIIQAEEKSGSQGYEFRLLDSQISQPWLESTRNRVPTLYCYAQNDVIYYQVVINRKVTARSSIPYSALPNLAPGTIFNKQVLRQQKENILKQTARNKHTPVMSAKAQEIARLHSAIRFIKRDPSEGYDSYFDNFDEVLAFAYAYAKQHNCLPSLITALHDICRAHNFDRDGYDIDNVGYGHSPFDKSSCSAGALGRLCLVFALCADVEEQARLESKDDNVALRRLQPERLDTAIIDGLLENVRHLIAKFNFKDRSIVLHLANIARFILIGPFYSPGFEVDSYQDTKEGAEKAVNALIKEHVNHASIMLSLIRTYDKEATSVDFPKEMRAQLETLLITELKKLIGLTSHDSLTEMEKEKLVTSRDNFRKTILTQIFPFILIYSMDSSVRGPAKNAEVIDYSFLITDLIDYFETKSEELPAVIQHITAKVLEVLEAYATRGEYKELDIFIDQIKSVMEQKIIQQELLEFECVKLAEKFVKHNNLLAYTKLAKSLNKNEIIDITDNTMLVMSPNKLKDLISHFLKNNQPEQLAAIYVIISDYLKKEADEYKPELISRITTMLKQLLTTFLDNSDIGKCTLIITLASYLDIKLSFYNPLVAAKYKKLADDLVKKVDGTTSTSEFFDILRKESNNTLQIKRMYDSFDNLVTLFRQGVPHATFALAKLYAEEKAVQKQGDTYHYIQDANKANIYAMIAYLQAQTLDDRELQEAITTWRKEEYSLEKLKQEFDGLILTALHASSAAVYQNTLSFLLDVGRAVDYKQLQISSMTAPELEQLLRTAHTGDADNRRITQLKRLRDIYHALKVAGCRILSRDGSMYATDPGLLAADIQSAIDKHLLNIKTKEREALASVSFTSNSILSFTDKKRLILQALRESTNNNICYAADVVEKLKTLPIKTLTTRDAQDWIYDTYRITSLQSNAASSSTDSISPHQPFNTDKIRDYLAKIAEMESMSLDVRSWHQHASSSYAAGSQHASSSYATQSQVSSAVTSPITQVTSHSALVNVPDLVIDYINQNTQRRNIEQDIYQSYSSIPENADNSYSLKVYVTGFEGAGKSKLILRYCDGYYTESYISTIGRDLLTRTLSHADMKVKLVIYDQIRNNRDNYHIRPAYNACHCVIFCFDITRPQELIKQQRLISDFSERGCTIVIAITKYDLADEWSDTPQITREYFEQFCSDNGYMGIYGVSAKNDTNVDLLFTCVAGSILANKQYIERKVETVTPILSPEPQTASTGFMSSVFNLFRREGSSSSSSSMASSSSSSQASSSSGSHASSSSGSQPLSLYGPDSRVSSTYGSNAQTSSRSASSSSTHFPHRW